MLIEKGRDTVIAIVDRTVREQLEAYREELTLAQIKLIAHQIAIEVARRIAHPDVRN